MTIFNPFNFDAFGVNVLTSGSYNIPSTKYAHVSAFCMNGGSVDINGSTVLDSQAPDSWTQYHWDNVTQVDVTLDVGDTFTVENEAYFEGHIIFGNSIAVGPDPSSIFCYVGGELYARLIKNAGTIEIRNAQNIIMGGGPFPVKLGDQDTIENRADTGYWNDPLNEIHVLGYEVVADSVTATAPGTTSSNTFWLPNSTSVSVSGTASAVITLYDKL